VTWGILSLLLVSRARNCFYLHVQRTFPDIASVVLLIAFYWQAVPTLEANDLNPLIDGNWKFFLCVCVIKMPIGSCLKRIMNFVLENVLL
jgi:hypothetical protein